MACEAKCFTFVWKLENISYCPQKMRQFIASPSFVIDAIDQTKWKLWLYPRGERDAKSFGFFLYRESDDKGANNIEIKWDLAFIAKDGSVLTDYGIVKISFLKGKAFGNATFSNRDMVFISRKSEFLPQDTLTVRCRIWKIDGEMTEDVRCSAVTRVGIEKKSLKWSVKNFSTLESGKKCTYQVKSVHYNIPLMSVDLSLTGGLNCEEMIRFELFLLDQTIKFSTLRLSLVDASGKRVGCNEEEIWFDDPALSKQLTFSFTKKKLLEQKNTYLPNDTLSLFWEWVFSKGVVSEEIEEDKNGCICINAEVEVSDAQNVNLEQITLFNCLADNVKSLYDEQFLSDVKLQTNTNLFPAHKFILSASSSVFKAMFSNDMKEKDGDSILIEDLSDETISRMLLFMYTTRVEDLTWESASNLYVAADKYAILSLKNVCSSFLKENLSPSNACEVLLLADLHADGVLKSAVQDYILKKGRQITKSDEWKALIQTDAKLAAETVCLLFK